MLLCLLLVLLTRLSIHLRYTSAGVKTDLSKVFHFLFIPIYHMSEPQSSIMCVSPVPDQHAWDIDALNINRSGLIVYAYPPMALLHRVITKNQAMQLPRHSNSPGLARDALDLGPSVALNRDPVSSVNNTSQTVGQ